MELSSDLDAVNSKFTQPDDGGSVTQGKASLANSTGN